MCMFQHEGWDDSSPTPLLVPAKPEVLKEIFSQARRVLTTDTVRWVVEKYGAGDYWRGFVDTFDEDRKKIGDGSEYYRTMMRKLSRAATKSAIPTVEQVVEKGPPKKAYVRQQLVQAIASSYMPNPFAPICVGSLVAVYLTDARCAALDLKGFAKFQPLIARVEQVLDADSFECIWLESQPARQKDGSVPNGMIDGYAGKWSVWYQEDEDGERQIPKSVLTSDDIYAKHFKFMPDSQVMCGPLQATLKKMLETFKSFAG